MEFKHPEIPSTEAAKIASANHKTNGKLGMSIKKIDNILGYFFQLKC